MNLYSLPKSIIEVMSKLEDGATGVVFGNRGTGVVGHYFNVVKRDGVVQFVDFQKGIGERILNPNTLMGNGKYNDLYFLNTTKKK